MDKMGVGLVGPGWVANEHIKAFQRNPHTEVVAICSRDLDRAKAVIAQHGLKAKAYSDYEKLLADPAVKIVSVCTPNHMHAEQGALAAEAGKHLVLEKPIAITLEQLERVRDAVAKAGIKSVVSFVLRWNPLINILHARRLAGDFGRVIYAEADYMHEIAHLRPPGHWGRYQKHVGSVMLSGGCHAMDALRWITGKNVVEVSAYSTPVRPETQFDYALTTAAVMQLEDGVVGRVTATVEAHMPYVFNATVHGDKGVARNNRIYTMAFAGQTGFMEIPTILPDSGDVTHHPFQQEIDHIVECILTDTESYVSVQDAVNTHEACLAADISAAENRPVRLPLLPARTPAKVGARKR